MFGLNSMKATASGSWTSLDSRLLYPELMQVLDTGALEKLRTGQPLNAVDIYALTKALIWYYNTQTFPNRQRAILRHRLKEFHQTPAQSRSQILTLIIRRIVTASLLLCNQKNSMESEQTEMLR